MDKLTQYTNTSLIQKTNELVDEINNKANTSDLDNYLPLTGGTINGALILAPSLNKSTNDRGIQLSTEATWFDFGYNWEDQVGAGFVLKSSNYPNDAGDSGSFLLYARNSESTTNLIANAYGAITWGGKNLVRSVNGSTADTSGNVIIDIPDTSDLVTTSQFNDSVAKLATKTELSNYVPLTGSAVKTGSLSVKQGSIYTQYLLGQSGSKLDIEDNTGTTQLLLGDSTLNIKTGTGTNAYKYAFSTNGITVTMPSSSDSSTTITKVLPFTVNGEEADSNGNITIDLAKVATSGSYNDLADKPTIPNAITIDSELSSTSTNPVQNKVISAALDNINVDVATNDEIDNALSLADDGIVPTDGVLGISNGGTGASTIEGIRANLGISPTTDFATVAFSGSYSDLSNTPTIPDVVTVDDTLSTTSTNPVQNKVINTALKAKAGLATANSFTSDNFFSGSTYVNGNTGIYLYLGSPNKIAATLTATNYTGNAATATKATQDADGNVISSTYAKTADLASVATSGSYNDLKDTPTIPDAVTVDTAMSSTSTNPVQNKVIYEELSNAVIGLKKLIVTKANTADLATVATSGSYNDLSDTPTIPDTSSFAQTGVANTWTAKQVFNTLSIGFENYTTTITSGSSATPSNSFAQYTATGTFTLDMISIGQKLSNSQSTVFTAVITSSSDYTLTITNAGTIKYAGSASDVAITAPGILLNILLSKDASGTLTSVIQTTALSS